MPAPHSWDIFCRVIDNFGDIGVSWRLARRLASRRGAAVRLWVDDVQSLRALCPQIDAGAARQRAENVEIWRWEEHFPAAQPAEVVVEAFGCGLPETYVTAMAGRSPRTLWIVLEYLSAEPWVREHHGLPSPHPRWPLERYFFFPGFDAATGGLLREEDLFSRRDAFDAAAGARLWAALGFSPPAAGVTVVSLFGYDDAPVAELLEAWRHGGQSLVAVIPEGKIVKPVSDWLGVAQARAGRGFQRGDLEVRIVPFVAQPHYDELLWASDCNFVRGEDSFVRAQWAAKPLVWQIYPQRERAHWAKLEAFLDRYCEGLPVPAAAALRNLWRSWNSAADGTVAVGQAWRAAWNWRGVLEAHALAWARKAAEIGEMSENLVQFCGNRL